MIKIKDLSINFSGISLFEDFNTCINYGDRIAIIGSNGCGKSSIMRAIISDIVYLGNIDIDGSCFYMPQNISIDQKSGGESFNVHLTEVISSSPDTLLMDEPTNHLDSENRKNLIRFVRKYHGTIIVASHDKNFINECFDILWIIDNRKIKVFHGLYNDYINESIIQKNKIDQEMRQLKRDEREIHELRMKEQRNAKNARNKGKKAIENKKWPTINSPTKLANSITTSCDKMSKISAKKDEISNKLLDIKSHDIAKLRFNFDGDFSSKMVASIRNGAIYRDTKMILGNIDIDILGGEKLVISGRNGSGKSSLAKAIIGDSNIVKTGDWNLPSLDFIGYLDQYYRNLNREISVFDSVKNLKPDLDGLQIRKILNDFLFRKNEEVYNLISNLSGGEMARLSLLHISLKKSRLIILDEINNNIDMATKSHIVSILVQYHGAMIIISHDQDFIASIGFDKIINLG